MHLLIDAGGTHLRVASADSKRIKQVLFFPVAKTLAANMQIVAAAMKELGIGKVDAAVIGIPRFKRHKLSIWQTKRTSTALNKITKSKVIVENDAALSALAEAGFGSGKGKKIVGYLTFSSGVGGAKVINGKIDPNAEGFEPNLELVEKSGKTTWVSEFVSGRGIARNYKTKAEKIQSKSRWRQIEHDIALLTNNAAAFWSPDIMVIGGPVALNKNISAARISELVAKNFKNMPKIPRVAKGQLGQLAGLYGALIRAKQ